MNTVRSGELRRSSRDHKSRAILVVGLRISLCQIPSASMVPASAHRTQLSTRRDDRKVSWAAITPLRPCHSMAWSDGISIIYIVTYLLTNKCPTSRSTDYALGVAHNTSRILATIANFSPAHSDSTSACVQEGVRTGSFFQRTLGFIRAVAVQKLHLQFLREILLFTFTQDSCVMSTIQQLLPGTMD